MYLSPPALDVATAPHQDAHSVFIVQAKAQRHTAHAAAHRPRARMPPRPAHTAAAAARTMATRPPTSPAKLQARTRALRGQCG